MRSRSPLLLARNRSALMVVDVQEKLAPSIENIDRLGWNISRLVRAAGMLGVPVVATEQYPGGLGHTVTDLASLLEGAEIAEKRMFSCRECSELVEGLRNRDRDQVVIGGIESHVCVLQSALDLVAQGFDVFVVADAVGSRAEDDYRWALERLMLAGATVVTTEMVLFEWCETSSAPEFKAVSGLVRESAPAEQKNGRMGFQ